MARTLAEIMASPESLQRAADDFVSFCAAQNENCEAMNHDEKTDVDLVSLLEQCGRRTDLDYYRNFCKIDYDV